MNQNAGERSMRIVHWLCLVSVSLFVSGVGFIVAGARTARQAQGATGTAAATLTPVATVKQIMKGIVDPAATIVFNAVSTTVSLTGTEEKAPETYEEWETVGTSAAALIESGNLLMIGSRTVDTDDWVKMSRAMIDSGTLALRAVTLGARGSIEYKYRLDKGEALLYSWKATRPVNYELHAEPDGAPAGYAESFEKNQAQAAAGTLTAPFSGIHGWYWENPTDTEVTVTLSAAGFYNLSHEFRKDAAPKTKIFAASPSTNAQ